MQWGCCCLLINPAAVCLSTPLALEVQEPKPRLLPDPQVPAPSCWADGMAPERVLKALEDMQQNQPNTDAEAMRFAISVSELQPDTGGWL